MAQEVGSQMPGAATEVEWTELLMCIGIPESSAKTYAATFVNNDITESDLIDLDKDTLKETMNISSLGHQLKIVRLGKRNELKSNVTVAPDSTSDNEHTPVYKSPSASASVKLPNISANMTHPQFRKALIDWNVYKSITSIPQISLTAHLYSACESVVQSSLINAKPNFLDLDEKDALNFIELIVTKHANPAVHRKDFYTLKQNDTESIQDFVVRLQTASPDCEFACPNCSFDLSETNIMDQLIRGLHNTLIQTDILTKASQLKTLQEIVNHAKSIESALRDQSAIEQGKPSGIEDVFSMHQS